MCIRDRAYPPETDHPLGQRAGLWWSARSGGTENNPYPSDFYDCSTYTLAHQKRTHASVSYTHLGDYLIPNLALPEEPEYQIGKYGHMRRSYLKEHRPIFYTCLLYTSRCV